MTLVNWLGWLISIPISIWLAWPLCFLLSMPKLLVGKVRKTPFNPIWDTPLGSPPRYLLAISINSLFVYLLLKPPLLYRMYYLRLMSGLLAGCLIWFLARITDRGFEGALDRARTRGTGAESILMLTQRVIKVVLLAIAILAALAAAGFNMGTAFAGLGIGGLAIALAAQKTLENVLGGVSLLMDKAVRVGDFCKIGAEFGVVEDIGLRSVEVRTHSIRICWLFQMGRWPKCSFQEFCVSRKMSYRSTLFTAN